MRDGQHAKTITLIPRGKIYPWLTLGPQVFWEERLGLDVAGLIVIGMTGGTSITAQGVGKNLGHHCLDTRRSPKVTTFGK